MYYHCQLYHCAYVYVPLPAVTISPAPSATASGLPRWSADVSATSQLHPEMIPPRCCSASPAVTPGGSLAHQISHLCSSGERRHWCPGRDSRLYITWQYVHDVLVTKS